MATTNDFTFINVPTQSSSKARDLARSTVCSHVARHGHRRRHVRSVSDVQTSRPSHSAQGLGLDESLRLPPLLLYQNAKTAAESNSSGRYIWAATNEGTPLGPEISSNTHSQSSHRAKKSVHRKHLSFHRQSEHPLNVANSGNSDPFACMPIDITPDVNNVLVFFHSQILDLHNKEKPTPPSSQYQFPLLSQALIYDTNFHTLQDECAFRSFLVFASSIRAKAGNNQFLQSNYRSIQNESNECLRSRLKTSHKSDDYVLYSVMALFCASVMAEDCQQATYHGRFLRNLIIGRLRDNVPTPLGLFKQALWADSQLATLELREGFLAEHSLIPEVLGMIDHTIQGQLAKFPKELAVSDDYDWTISSQPLRGCTFRLRQCLSLFASLYCRPQDSGMTTILFALCHACLCQLGFIKRYVEVRASGSAEHRLSIDSQHLGGQVEASICMAIIYLIDTLATSCCCFSRYVHKSDRLLSILQEEASKTIECMTQLELDTQPYRKACLFILFVVAQGERWQARSQDRAVEGAFDHCFVSTARCLGLKDWDDVKKVIELFVHIEALEPRGKEWVNELFSVDGQVMQA